MPDLVNLSPAMPTRTTVRAIESGKTKRITAETAWPRPRRCSSWSNNTSSSLHSITSGSTADNAAEKDIPVERRSASIVQRGDHAEAQHPHADLQWSAASPVGQLRGGAERPQTLRRGCQREPTAVL